MKPKSFLILFPFALGLVLAVGWLLLAQPLMTRASPVACVPGPHSGIITTSQTWCFADSPHVLPNSVVVTGGVTLTIEPDVIVKGNTNAELRVLGHLSAVGSTTQPITFTSIADSGPIQWAGLLFDGGTGDLQNVTVRYAGLANSIGYRGNVTAWNVQAGELSIQNSQIVSETTDFYLNISQCLWVVNSHVAVDSTLFSGCATGGGQWDRNYPVYVSGASSVVTLTNNTFVNNYKNRIALEPGAMMGQDATLWPQAVVEGYELTLLDTQSFTVPQGITLIVLPGVTVMGNAGRELRVLGHLEAIGTPSQPIIFTSVANSGPEQWSGLVFDGGTGHLSHTTVRHAGNANSAGYRTGITARNVSSGEVRVENSQIVDNDTGFYLTVNYGVVVLDSRAAVVDSLFSRNGLTGGGYYQRNYPLYIVGASSAVTLTGNTFTGNARNKIGLAPGAMSAQTSLTFTRQSALASYEFDGDYTILPTQTLTVESGVAVSGRDSLDELIVRGYLEAVGTPTLPITFTSGNDSGWNQWPGVVFDGGSGHLRYVTARYGGMVSSLNTYATINAVNVPPGSLLIEDSHITRGFYYGLQVSDSSVTVADSLFSDNGSDPRYDEAVYAYGSSTVLTLTGNRFQGNARDVVLGSGGDVALTNNAFLGGWPGVYQGANNAITIYDGVNAALRHTTIANLLANGVQVSAGGVADLTNSIFAQNTTGVRVEAGGAMTLTHTLWDRNGTDMIGTVSETGSVSGPAGFAPDGYHLTRYSTALERGADAGVADDIDGGARPLPAGTAPDLGADEYPYTFGDDFAAEKAAFDPQWVILPDPINGNPSGYLRQSYFIRYFYGSPDLNPPSLTVSVTDTLPGQLSFEAQESIPGMSFSQDGQSLFWQSVQPLGLDQSGEIVLSGLYNQPVAGDVLTNHAQLRAGEWWFDLQASAEVPLFPPLITFPGNGEICTTPGDVVTLTVQGVAQNSAIVKLYEDSNYLGETTATASGLFSFTYASTQAGVITTTLSAATCAPSSPSQCSDPYEVTLTPQRSFWDPQRTYWELTPVGGPWTTVHRFRDRQGWFSTQNIRAPKAPGLSNFTLRQYICFPVDEAWIVVDGVGYYPEPAGQGALARPAPETTVTRQPGSWVGGAVYVGAALMNECSWLNATLDLQHWEDSECWLTDPDGYVFDVTQGFDPLNPTLHIVEGVTVTAYVSMPQWGGWVPWPAQLYDNQVNPQVTGESGYFAFFTPPGHYYLQVEGIPGYQDWRSPVVEVITEIVHVNVPLTPWSENVAQIANLRPDGPDRPVITITAGDTVEWGTPMDGLAPPEQLIRLLENPVIRLLSTLDPLINALGWDGGLLAPGRVFRRQFTQPGIYTYTDGQGNVGTVVVLARVYLPLVKK